MRNAKVQHQQKYSRSDILAVFTIAAFGLVVVRLFFLQIIEGPNYRRLANAEQIKQYEIKAKRGLIYAMDGKKITKLVLNEKVYTLWADPHEIADNKRSEILSTLRKVAGGELKKNAEELMNKKESRYQVLAIKLTVKQHDEIKKKNYHGIGFTEETQRIYPEGTLAAQTLGFVNTNGGNYGVEQALNKELTGTDGYGKMTKDAYDQTIEVGKDNVEQPAKDGQNIALSIDRNVQAKVEKVLKTQMEEKGMQKGAVLVMNPKTGKVMAMANYPTYDPSKYSEVKDGSVFNNNTATFAYENGSVIKSFTMATGINEGVANASTTYNNLGYIQVGDRTIKNSTRLSIGTTTMQTAMNWSLNTGMVTIGKLLGGGSLNSTSLNKIYDYFHNKFGFGDVTGIEIGESSGLIYSPKSTEGNAVRYSNMTFGQGMTASMLQTTTAFCSLVNGGTLYKASLLSGNVDEDGNLIKKNPEVRRDGIISKSTSDQMRTILQNVRIANGIKDPSGYQVGGKTGTSQTIVDGKYVDFQTIGSYIGFGGGKDAEYVIMVAVWGDNQNLQGEKNASPIFNEISNWLLNYLEVKPNTEG